MIPYLAKGIQDLKDKLKLNDWFITIFFYLDSSNSITIIMNNLDTTKTYALIHKGSQLAL